MKTSHNYMRLEVFCFLTVIFGCINYACSTYPSKKTVSNYKMMTDTDFKKADFDSTILLLDQKSQNAETWDVLFYYKEFINLYEHSSAYILDATTFLANEKYNEREKQITLCSMQKARLEDYINIAGQCKTLYDKGKVSEDILKWAIAPNFSKSHLIVRNYDQEIVKNLLNNIYEDKNVSSELKETIKDILSGSLWNNIKDVEGNS